MEQDDAQVTKLKGFHGLKYPGKKVMFFGDLHSNITHNRFNLCNTRKINHHLL